MQNRDGINFSASELRGGGENVVCDLNSGDYQIWTTLYNCLISESKVFELSSCHV